MYIKVIRLIADLLKLSFYIGKFLKNHWKFTIKLNILVWSCAQNNMIRIHKPGNNKQVKITGTCFAQLGLPAAVECLRALCPDRHWSNYWRLPSFPNVRGAWVHSSEKGLFWPPTVRAGDFMKMKMGLCLLIQGSKDKNSMCIWNRKKGHR